jgi:predicted Zn-dependent peptidase
MALESGLPGFLLERHDLPLVHLRISLLSGGAAEPSDVPGAAYATSHMLEEGAGSRTAVRLSAAIQQIGAGLATWADGDTSAIGVQVLRTHLDRALDIVVDMLLRPRLEAQEWRRARADLRDRALGRRSEPGQVATLGLKAVVYGDHPYARPALPLLRHVEALGVGTLRRFHRAHYRRENGIVVAAGDVTARELEVKLGRRLAGWRTGSGVAGGAPAAKIDRRRSGGLRLAVVDRPGASQSVIRVGHLGRARRDAPYAALRLLNTILGGSFTSRLNQNLREKHGFTYGVGSSFSLPRGPGLFTVRTSVGTEDTVPALREIFRELEALRQRPVRRSELDKAKELVLQGLPAQAETLEALADTYSIIALHGLPVDTLLRLPEDVARVTPAALLEVAQELILPHRATVVVVGDMARLVGPLEKDYGRAQVLDEDGQPA